MRYLMTFSYDGSNYKGYQKQPNERTIQETIEKCLIRINSNEEVMIHASGRTDAKVHAINQKAHFNLTGYIPPVNLKKALNSLLPGDIYIRNIEEISPEFHARFNVKEKEYMYIMNIGEYNPMERNYVYQYNSTLDIDSMKKASKLFIGTHNFKSFTKADELREDYERTIFTADVTEDVNHLGHIIISFRGTGFLRYMVRNMVGLLIEIGEGKKSIEDVTNILKLEDRTRAGRTAPPEGLYLKDVFY